MRKISLMGLFCPKSLGIKHLLRTMKITLILLLFVTFQAYSTDSYSQNAKVSIPNAQLRVGQVLTQIESQTESLFVYNKKSVDVRRTVNVDVDNKSVAEVLDGMFEGTNIKYVMEGKNIVLTKNGEKIENIAGVQQEKNTVKGQEEVLTLETVVVTAMGIKRKSETLTYSVQQVNGDEMTRVKDPI